MVMPKVNTLAMVQILMCILALGMADVLSAVDSVFLAIVAAAAFMYFGKTSEKVATAPVRPALARWAYAGERCRSGPAQSRPARKSLPGPAAALRPVADAASESSQKVAAPPASPVRTGSQNGAKISRKGTDNRVRTPARPSVDQVRLNKELAKLQSPWAVLETVAAFEGSPNGVNLTTAIHRAAKSAKFSNIKVETVRDHPQFRQILELVMEPAILAQLGSQEITNLLWAFASLHFKDTSVVDGIIPLLKDQIMVFGCHEASITLWSLTSLGHQDSGTFEVLVHRAIELLDDLKGKEVVMVAWSMAMNRICMPDVFAKLAESVVKKMSTLNSQGVSVMVWSLASVGVKHDALFEAAAARVFSLRKEDIQNLDISNIVFAFAEQGCVHTELFAFLSSCPAVTQCMPDILEALETGKLTAASAWRKGAVTLRV